MDAKLADLAKAIKSGPAVLILGQDILSGPNGKDRFLETVSSKIGVESLPNYTELTSRIQTTNREETLAFLHNISTRIAPPSWLDYIAKAPWNAVFTSSPLDVVDRAFQLDWRNLDVLFDEKRRPENVRSRKILHLFKLFGCVTRNAANEEPPLNPIELLRRNATAAQMLSDLPFLITPQGVLIIEAYASFDWLKSDLLAQQIARLADGQAHIFSATPECIGDPTIKLLLSTGKLVRHETTLAAFLEEASSAGMLDGATQIPSVSTDVSFSLGSKSHLLTDLQWRKLAQGLPLLDDEALQPRTEFHNQDEKYEAFRQFLYGTHAIPLWNAFSHKFAFRRDAFDVLLSRVRSELAENSLKPKPMLVYGQSGVGKSVALADLAYTIRNDRVAVLYLGRNFVRCDGKHIDSLCLGLEELENRPMLIVWDARLDFEEYSDLARFLAGRGRKVLVVGAVYDAPIRSNKIEFTSSMSQSERKRLMEHLREIEPEIVGKLVSLGDDPHFLAVLYRLLPESRANLRTGLIREFERAEESIQRNITTSGVTTSGSQSSLGTLLLMALGEEWKSTLESLPKIKVQDHTGRSASFEYTFSGIVLIPGRYGLDVPIDLALRSLGAPDFEVFRQSLKTIDVYRWVIDDDGNDFLGTRHAIEAKLICDQRFSIADELKFIGTLIQNIRIPAEWDAFSVEIDFAVRLLRAIGPDGQFYHRYNREQSKLIAMLSELRKNNQNRSHPRLLLLEGHLRREEEYRENQAISQTHSVDQLRNSLSLLEEAKDVLSVALQMLSTSATVARRHEFMISCVHTEMATVHRAAQDRKYQLLAVDDDDINRAKLIAAIDEDYRFAIDHCKQAGRYHQDNAYPADVRFMIVFNRLRRDVSLRPEVRAELLADLCDILEEDSWEFQPEQYNKRLIDLSNAMNDPSLRAHAMEALDKMGSFAGHYLEVRGHAYDSVGALKDRPNLILALQHIERLGDTALSDLRMLRLYLTLWWHAYGAPDVFDRERVRLALAAEQWERLVYLLHRRLGFAEEDGNLKARFLYAWALFQVGRYRDSREEFRGLDQFTLSGKYRVVKLTVWADEKGGAITCNGTIRSITNDYQRGFVYCPTLRMEIPFHPQEFPKSNLRRDDSLDAFNISFNFRGATAEPARFSQGK